MKINLAAIGTSIALVWMMLSVGCGSRADVAGSGGARKSLIGRGEPLPELSVSGWINDQVTTADLEGKVVVIDAWAVW